MSRAGPIFCVVAILASLAASAVGYFLAALPAEVVAAARTPTPPERMGDIDLGKGFGQISVLDLVGYYIEHPPAPPSSTGVPARVRRFGGC